VIAPHLEQTQLYLDGRLRPDERAAAEQHLNGCAECRALVESWEHFKSAFEKSSAALLSEPSELQTQKLLRKAKGSPRRGRPMVWGFAAVAASMCAGVLWWTQATEVPAFAIAPSGEEVPVANDTVEPANDQLVMLGGDRLGVAAQSRLRLERHDTRQVRLRLEKGSVAASVTHRKLGQSFVISVGRFEVSVVGTRFRVVQLGQGIRVDVVEGRVRVKAPERTYEVVGGQALELLEGRAEDKPFADSDFAELSPRPLPPPTLDVDAGPPSEAPAEVVEKEETPKLPTPVPAAQIERWRRGALGGKCRELVDPIRRQAREHPGQAEVWRVLADCLRLVGDDRDSAAAYQHVAAVGGADEADRARLLLAGVLQERLHDDAEAERVLRAYLKHRQAPALEASARVKLARSLIALKKRAQAKSELQRVVKELPESPPALEALGLLKTLGP
jgi:ferric-dicitrate binding protein FerR (iron transport regulator)